MTRDRAVTRCPCNRGGLWETQDVYGDRQAEAAAKRVQRPSTEKTPQTKSGSGLNILRRGLKDKAFVVSLSVFIVFGICLFVAGWPNRLVSFAFQFFC